MTGTRPAARGRRQALPLLLLVGLIVALAPTVVGTPARAAAPTVSMNNLRTAWDSDEPGLTPGNVTASDFGKLFSTPVDGQVYAQPIVAAGTLVAATENNKVYGLDRITGAVRWTTNLGAPWPVATVGCGDLTPNIGVTSTPVYDPTTNSVFLLAKVNDGPDVQHPHWYLHALDPATGKDRPNYPLIIAGSPTNDPSHPFNSMTAMQRPGLLLLDGAVYAAFASHCDYGPYVGYVVGAKAATGQQTAMWSTEAGSSYAEAGIWQSGGGLVSDGPGRIILATGNGVSPPPTPGDTPPSTLAESVVRLQVNSDGSLTAKSFFSPANNSGLDIFDADLGSGSPMALPAGFGTAAHPHLVVQVGKDGRIFLLDADHLGGAAQGPNGSDAIVSLGGPFKGVWGSPGFFGGGGGYVYTVENGGPLRALRYSIDGSGKPVLALAGTSSGTFSYGSGSPTITSTGTSTGSALVWVVYGGDASGNGGELRAYDAVPSAGVLRLRYSAPVGQATKFSRVAIEDGRAYLGTKDGHILGFGRPTTAALTGTPLTDFDTVPVGNTANATVTVTATRALTLTSVTADEPFGVTAPSLPVAMTAGQQLTLPVTFHPTTPRAVTGQLRLGTSVGGVALELDGRGTSPGLVAEPDSLDFGTVATGAVRNLAVDVRNTGTDPVTLTEVTAPNAPFGVVTAPTVGTVIPAASSVAVSLSYVPTGAGTDSDSIRINSDAGGVTLPVSGVAVTGAPHLSVPAAVSLGTVPIGATGSFTFDVSNTGNVGLTLTKAAPPTGIFEAPKPMSEGQFLAAGDVLHQTVTFRPTAAGKFSAQYLITADDGRGPQNVTITGTAVDDPILARFLQVADTPDKLGSPLGPETAIAGGKMQSFSFGATVYWSPTTGARIVRGDTLTLYKALNGPAGVLGFPTIDTSTTGDRIGRYTHFSKGGSIFSSPGTGAHEVHGAIRTRYAAMGWERSVLGYPTTNDTVTPDRTGHHNQFSGGSIYWTPSTGAHEVHGTNRMLWASLGWEGGVLGYPTTDELPTPDGIGRFNHFSKNGSIYWAPTTGSHEVHGAIRSKWISLGWERSRYGYPTSNEYAIPGGWRQNFQHGTLTYANGVVR